MSEHELWAVHVAGPDDLLAMPDRESAERRAAEINEIGRLLRERPDVWPLDPHLSASVVAYPGSAQAHAESLAEFAAAGFEYTP